MKQNNFGRFALVVCIILWALYQVYPPTARDLVQEFDRRADNRDAALTNILSRVNELQKTATNSEFANLRAAIGTNDIVNYFTFVDAKNKVDPTLAILNQIQRDAAGKIKLGIDLQGGTSFLVEMDTNALLGQHQQRNACLRNYRTSAFPSG